MSIFHPLVTWIRQPTVAAALSDPQIGINGKIPPLWEDVRITVKDPGSGKELGTYAIKGSKLKETLGTILDNKKLDELPVTKVSLEKALFFSSKQIISLEFAEKTISIRNF
tara:strand:- start:261 stop:593 length:333 start_codon:yes stop_codon:yes gene_type:complete